ncbi:Crp/Fnr family transcriptional regulator [Streptosporangium sandarakinum]|uniref:Crp/Fnr family transcriptional regulator n=1 Tax=Streptosporangium sandarakinum TaxID=1260955 RepID=UPI00368BA24B
MTPRLRPAGQITFWAGLTPLERRLLLRRGLPRTVYRGDVILSGQQPNFTILRSSCWARLQMGNSSASRVVLDIAGPGDLLSALHTVDPVGPIWLGKTETIGVVLRRGRIVEIPREEIREILHKLPSIREHLIHRLSVQSHITARMHAVSRHSVEPRLAFLLVSLLYRYGEQRRGRSGAALAVPLSQPDLAGWIGASPASVARILQQWRSDGLVRTGHTTVTIVDVKRMIALAAMGGDSEQVPSWGSHSLNESLLF